MSDVAPSSISSGFIKMMHNTPTMTYTIRLNTRIVPYTSRAPSSSPSPSLIPAAVVPPMPSIDERPMAKYMNDTATAIAAKAI